MMLVKWETSPELIATRAVFTRDFCHRCSSMSVLYDIEQTAVPLNLYNGIIKMSAACDGSFLPQCYKQRLKFGFLKSIFLGNALLIFTTV